MAQIWRERLVERMNGRMNGKLFNQDRSLTRRIIGLPSFEPTTGSQVHGYKFT
jgi:hypothetical protein